MFKPYSVLLYRMLMFIALRVEIDGIIELYEWRHVGNAGRNCLSFWGLAI